MACLQNHCSDCIEESAVIEFNKGYQGRSIEATYPACRWCGRTKIWLTIDYREEFLKSTVRMIVRTSLFEQVVKEVLGDYLTKS